VEAGHDVFLISTEEGRLAMQHEDSGKRERFSQILLDEFRREHRKKPFDLVFTYLMDGMVDPEAIESIRRSGVPTCNFSCNNQHQFYLVDELSPHFDFNLHTEKDVRNKFLQIGANPVWWPMASNPRYFGPKDVPRTVDVSFVGENYALRARYVMSLLENGIDVHAYGPGWIHGSRTRWRSVVKHYKLLVESLIAIDPIRQSMFSAFLADHDFQRALGVRFPHNVHPIVSDDEMIALYSRSHVSLGFIEVYDQHNPARPVKQHLHLREFEAPMSGALYCTGYMDELAEFFEPDEEVVMYRNRHELLEKVSYYLSHPAEAERVRTAGRARALRDHTYRRRFETLFRVVGLEGA